ncbi:hypothetical protein ABN034_12590 [Actinopolymorpha sp. B11F2]|uniref:P-type ATPase n=1 Tax=Actinopolymorpha sp. B11F2 TaxID=3160862 RepID=UPI0032E52014
MLEAGAGLSAVSGSVTDAGLIATVMAANALFGGAQRVTTDRAIRRLADAAAAPVRVPRAGREVEVPSADVVPGDAILVQAGDAVPADCRIITASALETDESTLTGESQLVAKSAEPRSKPKWNGWAARVSGYAWAERLNLPGAPPCHTGGQDDLGRALDDEPHANAVGL